MICVLSDIPLVYFQYGGYETICVRIQIRSRSRWPGLTKDRFREILREEVVSIVREQIPNLFGSIKTDMMEFFDD